MVATNLETQTRIEEVVNEFLDAKRGSLWRVSDIRKALLEEGIKLTLNELCVPLDKAMSERELLTHRDFPRFILIAQRRAKKAQEA